MAKPGMGRGLAAILPETEVAEPELRELPVELIRRNPSQPRTQFGPDSIKALAASLADAGVVQPLIVRPLRDGRLVGARHSSRCGDLVCSSSAQPRPS